MNLFALAIVSALVVILLVAKIRVGGRGFPLHAPKWSALKSMKPQSSCLIQGRVWLTPHHSIHVVDVGSRTLVIGCHAQGMMVLKERGREEPVE